MFEKHEVWERCEGYTLIHTIFRDLDTGLYHQQQTSFLYRGYPGDTRNAMMDHAYYAADLFSAQLPSERTLGYRTLREAIDAHREDFE